MSVWTPRQEEALELLGGPATHIMLEGGSRSTKTFVALSAIATRAIASPRSRHACFRLRTNHARTTLVLDTWPKVMKLCYPGVKWDLDKKDWFATVGDDAEVWFAGLDDKDRVEKILGSEYVTLFFNECSQIPLASRNVALTRLAQRAEYRLPDGGVRFLRPKAYYDQNPPSKAHWTFKEFHEGKDPETGKRLENPQDYAFMELHPKDNPFLGAEYLKTLQSLPPRLKARFYEGRYAEATPNALWTEDSLESGRVIDGELPDMQRIAIGVDPSGAGDQDNSANDEIGIIVVGLGTDGIGYVLEDCTLKAGPAKWGASAVSAYDRHDADAVVGETNFGGDMVRFVVDTAASQPDREGKRKPTFKKVTASRGKAVRAEPIAALFETGKAKLAGEFRELETELCAFSTGGYTGEGSPNRADAMVWAFSELFPGMVKSRHDSPTPVVVMSDYHRQEVSRMRGRVPQVVTRRH